MDELRFAMIGAGFWAGYQLAAWQEVGGAKCVAVVDPVGDKAARLAARFEIPSVYADAESLLREQTLDFLDIVAPVALHAPLVRLAAQHRLPVICQKPLAATLAEAEEIVALCRETATPLFAHENWRWQTPIRAVKAALNSGIIGSPFRARIDMISGFPVFVNQPFFRDLKQFLITDMGSHILDVARFLFGEADSLYCQTRRVHPDIAGEDVATVMMSMGGVTVLCEMAYAENHLDPEPFPQTLMLIEGSQGSIRLDYDYRVSVTTADGTQSRRVAPPRYPWADPAYDVVQSSMVPCLANLLNGLRGASAETTGEDNLRTVRLVFAAYDSAVRNAVVTFPRPV